MSRAGGSGGRKRVPLALGGIVLLATTVRLVALGDRVAHWDEARIAYWVLQYQASGAWTYHPVFHGPLLLHVERWVIGVLGPSDAAIRLPAALIGGSLPAVAWLFRDRLTDREVLAMAGLLAANPILVYYSRFMRSDILVATFALAALGFALRTAATRRYRYAVGAGVAFGLALGAKENALLYLLAWIGAGTLWIGWQSRAAGVSEIPLTVVRHAQAALSRNGLQVVVAIGAMLPVLWAIYVPRGDGPGTLGAVLQDGSTLPSALEAGLMTPPIQAVEFWALGSAQGEYPYYLFFALLCGLLVAGAAGTLLLAGIGLSRQWDRPVVAGAGLWAGLSIVGYPAAADLMTGWIALHVVIPLTIPAAVGLVSVWDRPVEWPPGARLHRPVLAIVVAYLVISIGLTSFVAPGSVANPIGQPSQMSGAAGESITALDARLDGEGTQIAYIGEYWRSHIHRLPFLWYVERTGAERVFVSDVDALEDDPPPVLISHADRREQLTARHPAYVCREHERVPWEGGRPSGLPRSVLVCYEAQ